MELLTILALPVLSITAIIAILTQIYVVVEPNKAHVVVIMGSGRKVFSPHVAQSEDGEKKLSTAYFYIPFLMKRAILPLNNVKMEIPTFELKDKEVAPFSCEVTCWFRIKEPDVAVEKLDVFENGFDTAVKDTLEEQVRGIARAAAMKQEILDIMRDRNTFGNNVEQEVNGTLDEWGLELVKLEIVDFYDVDGSTVIADYEDRREAFIKSKTRQEVAERNKEANIAEAEAERESETARIQAQETIRLRDIQRVEAESIRDQEARLNIEREKEKSNKQEVEAQKTLEIGRAKIVAEAVEVKAQGEASATKRTAEGDAEAEKTRASAKAQAQKDIGLSEATVIEKKGIAEAQALDKKADAQKKLQESSKDIELAQIVSKMEVDKAQAYASAVSNADLRIVSDNLEFMGMNAKQGAGISTMVSEAMADPGSPMAQAIKNVIQKMGGSSNG